MYIYTVLNGRDKKYKRCRGRQISVDWGQFGLKGDHLKKEKMNWMFLTAPDSQAYLCMYTKTYA